MLPGFRGIFKYCSARGVLLPQAGPFAAFAPAYASSFPNFTTTGPTQFDVSTQAFPLRFNHLTINHAVTMDPQDTYCVIVQANVITFGAGGSIKLNGVPGSSSGTGSDGSSGGGGGSATDMAFIRGIPLPGGSGGSGVGGSPGTAQGEVSAGDGGGGTGSNYVGGFSWPQGGDGAASTDGLSTGGAGAPGYAGAGAGSGFNDDEGISFGAGGASAPGLVGLVCNDFIVAAGARLESKGAIGAPDSSIFYFSGPSGGGSIYVASRTYTGTMIVSVVSGGGSSTAGTASKLIINPNNSTTASSF